MAKKTKPKDDEQTDGSDSKTAPQVNDVAKPGQTPSSPTSRPVITGHGPMIKQDPMVAGKTEDTAPDNQKEETVKKNEITIKPVDAEEESLEDDSPKAEEKDKKDDTPDKPAAETAEDPPAVKTEDGGEEPESASSSDSAAIDSLATSAEAKKLEEKTAEEEKKKKDKIQELIAGRKYYIPIVEGGHKASSQRFMSWLLLILLLAAIGLYLAIDSGHLDIGISLPFDLIKN